MVLENQLVLDRNPMKCGNGRAWNSVPTGYHETGCGPRIGIGIRQARSKGLWSDNLRSEFTRGRHGRCARCAESHHQRSCFYWRAWVVAYPVGRWAWLFLYGTWSTEIRGSGARFGDRPIRARLWHVLEGAGNAQRVSWQTRKSSTIAVTSHQSALILERKSVHYHLQVYPAIIERLATKGSSSFS